MLKSHCSRLTYSAAALADAIACALATVYRAPVSLGQVQVFVLRIGGITVCPIASTRFARAGGERRGFDEKTSCCSHRCHRIEATSLAYRDCSFGERWEERVLDVDREPAGQSEPTTIDDWSQIVDAASSPQLCLDPSSSDNNLTPRNTCKPHAVVALYTSPSWSPSILQVMRLSAHAACLSRTS